MDGSTNRPTCWSSARCSSSSPRACRLREARDAAAVVLGRRAQRGRGGRRGGRVGRARDRGRRRRAGRPDPRVRRRARDRHDVRARGAPEPNGVYFAGADGEFVYARRGSAGSTLGPDDVARAPCATPARSWSAASRRRCRLVRGGRRRRGRGRRRPRGLRPELPPAADQREAARAALRARGAARRARHAVVPGRHAGAARHDRPRRRGGGRARLGAAAVAVTTRRSRPSISTAGDGRGAVARRPQPAPASSTPPAPATSWPAPPPRGSRSATTWSTRCAAA